MTFDFRPRPTKRMILRDLIGDVLRTLWAHKLRTFLTMFGIAWGIVSIVLMVAAGEGLRKGQEVQARNLGKDVMIVFHGRTSLQAGGQHAGRQVHWEDADLVPLAAETPDCQYAIPELEQDTVQTHSNFNAAAAAFSRVLTIRERQITAVLFRPFMRRNCRLASHSRFGATAI